MRVQFAVRENGPERLVCEAEIVFDEPGPLWNMKLVGFAIWEGHDGDVYVTFPSRAFGAGSERRYFEYLRPMDADTADAKNVKSWIIAEYRRHVGTGGSLPSLDGSSRPPRRPRREA